MNNIFISYRRADSADVVGRIYDHLKGVVGKDNIFKDIHSVQLGIDYLKMTTEAVANCDVLLAIVGNRWLDGRRIDDPNDLVRVEIETAMGRDIPVIPVLVGGAEMPAQDELPDGLKPLGYRNAIKVRPDPDFPTDMARLVEALGGIISIKPAAKAKERSWIRKLAPVAAALVVAVGVWSYFVGPPGPGPKPFTKGTDPDAGSESVAGAMTRSADGSADGAGAGQDRAMDFVDQFNSTGQILDARNRVSEATNKNMEAIAGVLRDPDLDEQQLAVAYNDAILQMIDEENLDTPLEQLFKFHEQVLICREMQLCDEQVISGFLDNEAGSFTHTFYPWVCRVRADWNNPTAFQRVLDFYVEGNSATVCDR